jgi:hypothetical protein
LVGWLYFDLGRANEAANAWRSTLKIDKDTGDGALAAYTLGYWSYLAASRNDVAPAVRLLQQAQEYVPGSSAPATRSWLSAREAEDWPVSVTRPEPYAPWSARSWTPFFTANRLGGLTVST